MPDDGIYRAILMVLMLSVIAGVVAMLVGARVLQSEAMETAGVGLALVSGALYFFFRWLGRREMKRRGGRGTGGGPHQRED